MFKRLVVSLAALAAGMSVSFAQSPARADSPETLAAVKDSMIYLDIAFTGRVLVPGEWMSSGEDAWIPAETGYNCSGFVVDPAGFIATAGHCVEVDQAVKEDLRIVAAEAAAGEDIAKSGVEAAAAREAWRVEGPSPESEVDRKIQVVQPIDPDRQIDEWTTVNLVDFQPFENGDNALVRLSGLAPLKPLVIAEKVPEVGASVTSVGFPGNIRNQNFVDPDRVQQPSFKTGTVSSHQVKPTGAPTLEINAQVSPGMSGGPTIDENAYVVGINSFGVGEETHGFEFVTDTVTLRTLMQRNGVQLATQAAPPEESSFPWVIVGIVVVVAAGLVAAIFLRPKWFGLRKRPKIKRRRRRPRKRAGTPPAEPAPAAVAPPVTAESHAAPKAKSPAPGTERPAPNGEAARKST